jgi:hypothetical protein
MTQNQATLIAKTLMEKHTSNGDLDYGRASKEAFALRLPEGVQRDVIYKLAQQEIFKDKDRNLGKGLEEGGRAMLDALRQPIVAAQGLPSWLTKDSCPFHGAHQLTEAERKAINICQPPIETLEP